MAACMKLSTFVVKNEFNKLFLSSPKIFQQSVRTNLNCLGDKRVKKPNLNRKKPRPQPRVNDRVIWPDADSVQDKGFLRPQKEYIPPADIEVRLDDVFKRVAGTSNRSTILSDPAVKYNLLDTCYEEFNHKVPNSILYKINSLDDVFNYYLSPVDVRTPLEQMKTKDLPPNLHILYEYHRFADDPSKFNGITALPENNNVVTSLKYRKKYKGFVAPRGKKEYDNQLKL